MPGTRNPIFILLLCLFAVIGNGALLVCAACPDKNVTTGLVGQEPISCCSPAADEQGRSPRDVVPAETPERPCATCVDQTHARQSADANPLRLLSPPTQFELLPVLFVRPQVTLDQRPLPARWGETRGRPVVAHAPVQSVVLLI